MSPEVYSALTAVFRDVFGRDDIALRPELTARDIPGWNSFKQIEIIMEVEGRFAIHLESQDVDNLENVGDLADIIAAKLQAAK